MRILYLTHAFPKNASDRTTVFVREFALALQSHGHQLKILAPFHPELDLDYQYHSFDFETFHYAPFKSVEVLGYGQGVADGLHLNFRNYFLGAPFLAMGAAATVRAAAKFAPDIIYSNWGIPGGLWGAKANKAHGIPVVISWLGADVRLVMSNAVIRSLVRSAIRFVAAQSTNSNDLKNTIEQFVPSGPNLQLIPYGAQRDTFVPSLDLRASGRSRHGIAHDAFVVAAVGRFIPKKGFKYLLDCAALLQKKLPKAQVILVGDGPEMTSYRKVAKERDLNNVVLVGPVPPSQLPEVYNMADVFVNPAVREPVDGLNVVVPEAMGCGKPVIGSNACGNEIAIVDGENGYLVPEKDPVAITERILQLAGKPDRLADFGRNARVFFEQNLSWESVVRQYTRIFESIVG